MKLKTAHTWKLTGDGDAEYHFLVIEDFLFVLSIHPHSASMPWAWRLETPYAAHQRAIQMTQNQEKAGMQLEGDVIEGETLISLKGLNNLLELATDHGTRRRAVEDIQSILTIVEITGSVMV